MEKLRIEKRIVFIENAKDGDTLTIEDKVYTFQDTLTNVGGNVQIGTTKYETAANLAAALDLSGVPGGQYAASTVTTWGLSRIVIEVKK